MNETKRQAIRRELEAIRTQHGGILTPVDVVNAARDPESPLHDQFTWDTEAAAYQHQLNQARSLIRSVRVEVVEETIHFKIPQYIRNPEAEQDEQGYVPLLSLRSDEDAARAAVVNEFSRAAAALRRAKGIARVLNMEDAVHDLLVQVEDAHDQIQAAM